MKTSLHDLRLWVQGGQQWMAFGGEDTDQVATSPSGRWYCGAFAGSRMVILGNTAGRVLRFAAPFVLLMAVDDQGRAAILEQGSGHARIRVLWPDGTTSQPRIKNAASILELSISGGVLECSTAGGGTRFSLAGMERKAYRGALLRSENKRRWLWLIILSVAVYLYLKYR
jgi:hypothetical protein